MSTTYDYTPGAVPNLQRIDLGVADSEMTDKGIESCTYYQETNSLKITFTNELSAPDKTLLDGIVAASEGKTDPDCTCQPCFNFMDGLELEWVSTSQVKVLAGKCRDADCKSNMFLNSDTTIALPADLDTGELAPDTYYHILLCGGASGFKLYFSTSPDSPQAASGYQDFSRRIGVVRTNGQSEILNFRQTGSERRRTYEYWVNRPSLRVLSNGTATQWTEVDCSAFVPPTASRIMLSALNYTPSATANAYIRPYGHPGGDGQVVLVPGNTIVWWPTNQSQKVEYKGGAESPSLFLDIFGFEEYV